MSVFRVGQRVRVVKARAKHLIGCEGVIVPHDGRPGMSGKMYDYDVILYFLHGYPAASAVLCALSAFAFSREYE